MTLPGYQQKQIDGRDYLVVDLDVLAPDLRELYYGGGMDRPDTQPMVNQPTKAQARCLAAMQGFGDRWLEAVEIYQQLGVSLQRARTMLLQCYREGFVARQTLPRLGGFGGKRYQYRLLKGQHAER